ncbi:unnamed protein product [Pedinophyceae sp. YPF-701]|nr:unnamed protein product [Pedinophyceae sp. YPF-701]
MAETLAPKPRHRAKERVLHIIDRLADRDTHGPAIGELAALISRLDAATLPVVLSCLSPTASDPKAYARREMVAGLAKLVGESSPVRHTALQQTNLAKILQTLKARMKDQDASVREAVTAALVAVAEAMAETASPYGCGDHTNPLVRMLMESITQDRNRNVLDTACHALAGVVRHTGGLEVTITKQIVRLLSTATFRSHAGILHLIGNTGPPAGPQSSGRPLTGRGAPSSPRGDVFGSSTGAVNPPGGLVMSSSGVILPYLSTILGQTGRSEDAGSGSGVLGALSDPDWAVRRAALDACTAIVTVLGPAMDVSAPQGAPPDDPARPSARVLAALSALRFDRVRHVRDMSAAALACARGLQDFIAADTNPADWPAHIQALREQEAAASAANRTARGPSPGPRSRPHTPVRARSPAHVPVSPRGRGGPRQLNPEFAKAHAEKANQVLEPRKVKELRTSAEQQQQVQQQQMQPERVQHGGYEEPERPPSPAPAAPQRRAVPSRNGSAAGSRRASRQDLTPGGGDSANPPEGAVASRPPSARSGPPPSEQWAPSEVPARPRSARTRAAANGHVADAAGRVGDWGAVERQLEALVEQQERMMRILGSFVDSTNAAMASLERRVGAMEHATDDIRSAMDFLSRFGPANKNYGALPEVHGDEDDAYLPRPPSVAASRETPHLHPRSSRQDGVPGSPPQHNAAPEAPRSRPASSAGRAAPSPTPSAPPALPVRPEPSRQSVASLRSVPTARMGAADPARASAPQSRRLTPEQSADAGGMTQNRYDGVDESGNDLIAGDVEDEYDEAEGASAPRHAGPAAAAAVEAAVRSGDDGALLDVMRSCEPCLGDMQPAQAHTLVKATARLLATSDAAGGDAADAEVGECLAWLSQLAAMAAGRDERALRVPMDVKFHVLAALGEVGTQDTRSGRKAAGVAQVLEAAWGLGDAMASLRSSAPTSGVGDSAAPSPARAQPARVSGAAPQTPPGDSMDFMNLALGDTQEIMAEAAAIDAKRRQARSREQAKAAAGRASRGQSGAGGRVSASGQGPGLQDLRNQLAEMEARMARQQPPSR